MNGKTLIYALTLLAIVLAAYIYKFPQYEKKRSEIIGTLPPLKERVPPRLRHKVK